MNECEITADQKEILRRDILKLDIVRDVGFADVSAYKRVPGGSTPYTFLSDAKTAVVSIVYMDDVIPTFGRWYVVCLNNFLKQTNEKVVAVLKTHGIYGCGLVDERPTNNLIGKVSFRQLAVLAGLGTIGRNGCLLHPVYGPRVNICVVLTNSYIQSDQPLDTELCFNCDICIKECQIKALSSTYFDRHKCRDRQRQDKGCGRPCIYSCPVG